MSDATAAAYSKSGKSGLLTICSAGVTLVLDILLDLHSVADGLKSKIGVRIRSWSFLY